MIMPTHQPNAAMKETTCSPSFSSSRVLKPKYDVFWGVFDGYIRSFYGTKRALINRLKRISYINFVDDLRILDEDGRVVYGDIEFDDVKSPEYGNFFSREEWSECIDCIVLSDQEVDDICAMKDGYYFGKQYAVPKSVHLHVQRQPNAAMKLTAASVLAVLLLASPGHSQTAGNCFTLASYEDQKAGSPAIIPVDSCNENCLRQSCIAIRRSGERSKHMTPVPSCTKDDLFEERRCDDDHEWEPGTHFNRR